MTTQCNDEKGSKVPSSYDMERMDTEVQRGEIKHAQPRDVDPALQFLATEEIEYTPAESRTVLSKIDRVLMPLLCWVYLIQFADKTSLNYASLMGIREDTHLDPQSQQYSWVSSIFYAGYIFWEFPTTYLLRRLPLGKYTSFSILVWGIVLLCHVAAHNYAGLLCVRFFLGAFEATVTPAFVLFTSCWYKQEEQAKRMGFWLACNGAAQILIAAIAYGLSGVREASIAVWKILFLVLGLPTVLTGLLYFWLMPDNQIQANFLSQREKLIAVDRIRGNFQGIGSRTWKWAQFFEAFRDPRTYLYVLFSLLMNIPNGGITTFGSLIINSFGFSSRMSLMLNMPMGLVDIACKLGLTYLSDRYLDRTSFAILAILIPMLGGILMIVLPLHAKAGLLVGYYCIGAAGTAWCLVMVMISNNTLGYTKKATVNGLQILAYAAGNWIGPQTFRSNQAPEYFDGKLMVAIMYALAAATLLAIRLVNIVENKRRDRQALADPDGEGVAVGMEFLDLTDFEQPAFRYVL
ncbi:major facilitator superfamily domain-containing protein [Aspergillus tamarii]|uniref:Major facilitator superfamily domain-containing protein n=1 Tax=Aspergillus tamarii TaxID=41984 RepID=A0A5N6UJV9_ASPTM|nr:major facilitator superfamily domain-containing protein [Aspergillus tamarii]